MHPATAQQIDGLLIKHVTKDAASKAEAQKGYNLTKWIYAKHTPEKWVKQLEYGYTICLGTFEPKIDGTYTHAEGNWRESPLMFLDGDNFTTEKDATDFAIEPWTDPDELFTRFPSLKSKAFAVTESVSSMSKEKPHRRYRLIFLFDEPITNGDDFRKVLTALATEYPIIPLIERHPAQPVFGNARKENRDALIFGNVLCLESYLESAPPPTDAPPPPAAPTAPKPTAPPPSQTPSVEMTLDEFIRQNNIATLKPREKGGYFVECPFEKDHASGKNTPTDAFIFEANTGGGFCFHCSHTTCQQKGRSNWAAFREATAPKRKQTESPPPAKQQQERTASTQENETPIVNEIIERITAKDLLLKDFEPLKWVVDDLIPEGLTVLAGAPKIGKSFFCWNLALAVSQAGIFLSQYPVQHKRNVIYFALEDPQRQIKNRLQMIQPDTLPPENLTIYTRYPIVLSGEGLESWEQTITEHEAELVIIDTLHHTLPQATGNGTAYQQDYSLLAPVQRMVHRLGISIILVTHTRKAIDVDNPFNQIQGSVAMQAACDTMMMLVTDAGDKILSINGREVLPLELAVEIKQGVFVSESMEDRAEKNLSDTRSLILSVVKSAGKDGITFTEIKESVTEKGENALKMTIRRMVSDGQIHQPKQRGKYYHAKPDEFLTELDDIPL